MTHVLDKFKFCPVCGSQHFEINNFKSKKCKDCGFTYYLNPSSATVAFILNEKEELLVVRRKNEPAKGTLDLPGGFVDMDETGEEGVAREVKEETGLEVIEANYQFSIPNLYLYSDFLVHTLDMFYVVKVKDLSCGGDGRCRGVILDSSQQPTSRRVRIRINKTGSGQISCKTQDERMKIRPKTFKKPKKSLYNKV